MQYQLLPPQEHAEPVTHTVELKPVKPNVDPVTGGFPIPNTRISQPDIRSFMPGTQLQEVNPEILPEWMETLEHLAVFHEDVQYAVDNLVQLGCTNHSIEFPDKTPQSMQKEMREYISTYEGGWYNFSATGKGLKSDLLFQAAVYGAVSTEAVPAANLKSLKEVARVNPKRIRFVYDNAKQIYLPYQKPINVFTSSLNGGINGMIALNPVTYKYAALRRFNDTPYAIPPFISVMNSLVIKKKMVDNMAFIMEKMGMLGFLSAKVTPPPQGTDESDEDYMNRCFAYLQDKIAPQVRKNFSTGVAVGFTGHAEFQLEGTNMNTQGAGDLMKIIQGIVFSALKQDPNMMGFNYSTTETFGRVILSKLTSQVNEYQSTVDSAMAHIYRLALRLAGYNVDFVTVKSEKAMVGDQVKEAEAEGKRIDNVVKKVSIGFINMTQGAQELGYEKAESDVPLSNGQQPQPTETDPDAKDPANVPEESENARLTNKLTAKLYARIGGHVPAFPYGADHRCGHAVTASSFMDSTDFGDRKTNSLDRSYFNEIHKLFLATNEKARKAIRDRMEKLDQNAPVESVQRDLYVEYLKVWESNFASQLQTPVSNNINAVYDHFRKDKKVFPRTGGSSNSFAEGDEIPAAVFDLSDVRAIEFMEQVDELYLGKIPTDADTRARINKYIVDNYLRDGMPIGKDKAALDKFANEFRDVLNLEGWKIRRIIDTSVIRMRSYGHINYLNQAQVEEYEIIEMLDQLTCEYCQHVDGFKFSVAEAHSRISKEISGGPEGLFQTSPFATSLKIADFKALDSSALSAQGIMKPPFHPHCRGRIVGLN